ncbi:MAG: GAF domain-containing sensor histidine kinase [Chloroflexi bacterium]|nr:GAF domain-containing sensor histidine kinase [Chloroflexota bacterium]
MMNKRGFIWAGFLLTTLFAGLLELLRYLYFEEAMPAAVTHGISGGSVGAILVFTLGTLGRTKPQSLQQTQELIDLHAGTERRNTQFTALSNAAFAMTSELSSEAVFQQVIDLAREVASARYSALAVLDENGQVEAFLTSGITTEERARLGQPPTMKQGLLAVPLQTGHLLRVPSIGEHPRSVGFPEGHPPMERFLGVPVVSKGKTVGQLYLTNEASEPEFSSEDEEIMTLFARQAAVAIENARLYRQVQTLAILEERERIARDLHDSVIQSLYALGLRLENVVQTTHDIPKQVADQLSYSVDKLDEVIRDLRNNILGLNPQVYYGKRLNQGLEDLLTELQLNAFVNVNLSLPEDLDEPLSSSHRLELLQVMREAMTNILKHAQARKVTVKGTRDDGLIKLTVTDDGKGFDPQQERSLERQGLRNMDIRVQRVGGWLEVDSALGTGTTISVNIPITEADAKG